MRFHDLARRTALFTAMAAAASGCTDSPTLLAPAGEDAALRGASAPAPASLVTVGLPDGELTLWPFINFSPEDRPHDPVNLVFIGHADPRNIRDALLSLDGARPAPFSAFTCTWTDAIGGLQVAYGEPLGWTGSVIQMECGAYDPFRFHIRLFPMGDRTLANAHVEILIPGTQSHQVLSWEVAEQLITFELARGGLLGAAPTGTGPISPAPTFGEIPARIYNLLTPELRALAGGPADDVTGPVGMASDGSATVLTIGADVPAAPGSSQAITIAFGQFVPKPFCAQPGELVRVDGLLDVEQTVRVTATGDVVSEMTAQGDLTVRSVTSTGLGDPITARIRDHNSTGAGAGENDFIRGTRFQRLIPESGPVQQLQEQLRVGPHSLTQFRSAEHCGS